MGTEGMQTDNTINYSVKYKPNRDVRMIKKDGTREVFNIQNKLCLSVLSLLGGGIDMEVERKFI